MGVVSAIGAGLGLAGALFGGDDSPPPPPQMERLTPPGPFQEIPVPDYIKPASLQDIMDTIDLLNGAEIKTVTTPDGKKQRVLKPVRTPEEDALYREIGTMLSKYVQNVNTLASYSPRAAQQYAPFMQSIEQMSRDRGNDIRNILGDSVDYNAFTEQVREVNKQLIDETFRERYSALDESLAHRGMSTSSAANEARALLARAHALARTQGEIDAMRSGQALQAQDTANRSNEFMSKEQARAAQYGADLSLVNAEQDMLNQENQNQLLQLDNSLRAAQIAQGLKTTADVRSASTMAPNLALGEYQAQNQLALGLNTQQNNVLSQGFKDRLTLNSARLEHNQVTNNAKLGNNQSSNAGYKNQLENYKMQGPSFGQVAMNLGGMALGNAASKWGSRLGDSLPIF